MIATVTTGGKYLAKNTWVAVTGRLDRYGSGAKSRWLAVALTTNGYCPRKSPIDSAHRSDGSPSVLPKHCDGLVISCPQGRVG